VKQRISDTEQNAFNITCMLYRGLAVFDKCISNINMWTWWIYAHNHPEQSQKVCVLCRLLVGQHCLKDVVSHYDKSSPICELCDNNVAETVEHLLFNCSFFSEHRKPLWKDVLHNAPVALCQELDLMNSAQKTAFILSGLKCDFVAEWGNFYTAILNFCCALYKERRDYLFTPA